MKLAISLLTCGKPELVEQSIEPLTDVARANKFHLFVCDGSLREADEDEIYKLAYPTATVHANVRGGAGAAIVYALSMMLASKENYTHVGLCESDVLLQPGWLDCLSLFDRGAADGLHVGAVSARAYEDRVLFQRDGYAVMHNIGAGMIIFTREAAKYVLDHFRTGFSTDNRRIFSRLAGVDIGSYWAFRLGEHNLTADWHWEAVLASIGFASVALTPSPVEMIGQNPPLAEQGLQIVTEPLANRVNDEAFSLFAHRLRSLYASSFDNGIETRFHFDPNTGTWTYYPHQMHMLDGEYAGDWRLVERRGWGTFGWVAGEIVWQEGQQDYCPKQLCELTIPVFGPCCVLISGGKEGGQFEVFDEASGFKAAPELPPEGEQGQVLQMQVPGGMSYRTLRITALKPGGIFYGIQTREKQPFNPNAEFRYEDLPKP
jgi:hypothetical protein